MQPNPPNFRCFPFGPPPGSRKLPLVELTSNQFDQSFFGLCRSRSFFDEALIADSSSILQGEIDPSSRVNFGSAFSARFGSRFAHCYRLKVFFIWP